MLRDFYDDAFAPAVTAEPWDSRAAARLDCPP